MGHVLDDGLRGGVGGTLAAVGGAQVGGVLHGLGAVPEGARRLVSGLPATQVNRGRGSASMVPFGSVGLSCWRDPR